MPSPAGLSPLLVANRGEIACRVIRTARRLGLRTVAVFSDADRDALHVGLADEAVRLGPPAPAASYLDLAAVLAAAARTGARAVHPGYGFLAENPAFARACAAAGLAFIGPDPAAMERLGDKDSAKAVARAAGVPTVPGWQGADQSAAGLLEAARGLGFPLLIKAVAGGGGRGMRRVDAEPAFDAALEAARREAAGAFGRDSVLLERLIRRPRHVEVQVVADGEGRTVHLFERDCTLQRRHQKVIEEAPAPGLPAELRDALGRAAVAVAGAAGYRNAGTVEFLLEPDGRFWFIEMNTRLQVEHPVTELVTGVDLVEWQLRVAAGEPLPLRQGEIALDGHAVEARLNAEDPAKGFLPSIGPLRRFRLPGGEGRPLRLETGVREGDAVTPFYDSMVAKLVAWGPTRDMALDRLAAALGAAEVEGPATNLGLLRALCAHPAVRGAGVDTTWLDREAAAGGSLAPAEPPPPGPEALALAGLAALLDRGPGGAAPASPAYPWDRADGWRLNAPSRRVVRFAEPPAEVEAISVRDALELRAGAVTFRARSGRASDGSPAWVELDGHRRPLPWRIEGDAAIGPAGPDGRPHRLRLEAEGAGDAAGEGTAADAGRVVAAMPGRVARVLVRPGDAVAAGAALLVLEAMKMEHTLEAAAAGRVAAVAVAAGDQVDEGATLVEIELAS